MNTLSVLHKRVAGVDVHRMQYTVTVLLEAQDGTVSRQVRSFGGFRRDVRSLTAWLAELKIERVTMESTGIFWRSLYAHLERAGIPTWVVNAHAVKHVPGRKTDVCDSEWLALLGRFGLVRPSFIPPADLRELRVVSRYRHKLVSMRSSEVNRLHKLLDDCGIKLGGVVSDLQGVSAKAMVAGLLEGKPIEALLGLAQGKLKEKTEDLRAAMDGELTARHKLVMQLISDHLKAFDADIARIDLYLVNAMVPYRTQFERLQTIPGIDVPAAAMILIEIGDNMDVFGHADRIASWAGLCPGNNESAGKRKSGQTRRANYMVRTLMCECAQAAARTQCSLKAWFQNLLVRKSYKKCVVALAHRMIRLIYLMLSKGVVYIDPNTDYAAMRAKKNAPRWIKQLKKMGQFPNPTPIVNTH